MQTIITRNRDQLVHAVLSIPSDKDVTIFNIRRDGSKTRYTFLAYEFTKINVERIGEIMGFLNFETKAKVWLDAKRIPVSIHRARQEQIARKIKRLPKKFFN